MTAGGSRVDRRAELIGKRDRRPLAIGAASRQPVDQWGTGGPQNLRGTREPFVECHRPPVDLRRREEFGCLLQQPGFREGTRILGVEHPTAVDGDPQIIADTSANRAGDVFNGLAQYPPVLAEGELVRSGILVERRGKAVAYTPPFQKSA